MNFTCPECTSEDAYFDILDETGAHYICPICDYEWSDTSFAIEDDDEEEENDDEL